MFFLMPPDIRMEDFVYEKLDKKKRDRVNHHEVLGQVLVDGGNDFGPGTTYGEDTIWQIIKCIILYLYIVVKAEDYSYMFSLSL